MLAIVVQGVDANDKTNTIVVNGDGDRRAANDAWISVTTAPTHTHTSVDMLVADELTDNTLQDYIATRRRLVMMMMMLMTMTIDDDNGNRWLTSCCYCCCCNRRRRISLTLGMFGHREPATMSLDRCGVMILVTKLTITPQL